MRQHPQQANNLADNGYSSINQILLADFKDGKWDQNLGARKWVYDDNDLAYREALSNEPVEDDIESIDRLVLTAIPDDYFFEEEYQNPD